MKLYEKPVIEFEMFVTEDAILASGFQTKSTLLGDFGSSECEEVL